MLDNIIFEIIKCTPIGINPIITSLYINPKNKPTIEYSMIIMEVDHETTARAVSSTEFNGHKYVFYVSDLNWDEAKEYCENMGGHLATITSQEEQNALNVAYNLIYKTNNIWFLFQIGASDVNQEGVWEWITGEPFNYTNFMDGQPNYTTIENYLSMGTQWNDIGLDITLLPKTVYGFILEIE